MDIHATRRSPPNEHRATGNAFRWPAHRDARMFDASKIDGAHSDALLSEVIQAGSSVGELHSKPPIVLLELRRMFHALTPFSWLNALRT